MIFAALSQPLQGHLAPVLPEGVEPRENSIAAADHPVLLTRGLEQGLEQRLQGQVLAAQLGQP